MHYHRITAFFTVIILITACLPEKEQQPTTAANTQNNPTHSSSAVFSINDENIKSGVEFVGKGYESGGMTQIKEAIVDCHDKLKASNDLQLLELCTVIEVTSSNLNNDFVKKLGIAGTAFDDQFFSFDSMGSRVESAWIRAGFTDKTQREKIIKLLVGKTGSYYNQSPSRKVTLPMDWRFPKQTDFKDDWLAFKDKLPEPFHVRGDFNGDKIIDEAWILLRNDNRGWGFFIFLAQLDETHQIIKIEERDMEINPQSMGIDLVKPGEYRTACGKGYWDCGTGEPPILKLNFDAVEYFVFESASSIVYWNEEKRQFEKIAISD